MANNGKPRIVLQFSECDSRHRKVLEIMRSRSRGKTELVVNAILHYISCPDADEEMGKDMIRKVVLEVIHEMQVDGSLSLGTPSKQQEFGLSTEDAADLSSLMGFFREEA